jgi:transcriptional regulator with XRE-family HTH domain
MLIRVIGNRIKDARTEQRLSQLKLGIKLGVTDKTVSGYESGRISPPIDKLVQMAQIFKKPISYFLGEENFDQNISQRLKALEINLKEIRNELIDIKKIHKRKK